MIFPFDVIDWLFGIGGKASAGIGDWFKRIGADIASGLEAGFVAILKDIWDVARPFLFILIGVMIMAVSSLWLFTGSGSVRAAITLLTMVK